MHFLNQKALLRRLSMSDFDVPKSLSIDARRAIQNVKSVFFGPNETKNYYAQCKLTNTAPSSRILGNRTRKSSEFAFLDKGLPMTVTAADLKSLIDAGDAEKALSEIAKHDESRRLPLEIHSLKYAALIEVKDYHSAVLVARELIRRRHPHARTIMNNNHIHMRRSGHRATLLDYAPDVDLRNAPARFVLSAMPKSGSTFLVQLMIDLHKLIRFEYFLRGDESEQELSLDPMKMSIQYPVAVQQHFRASEMNIQLLQAFQIEPVVLIRNIKDALVSMADMLETTDLPIVYFQDWIAELDRTALLDAVICKWAHWYIEYYVSWVRAERDKRLSPLIIRYEDLMQDKVGHALRISEHCKLEARSKHEIEEGVARIEGDREKVRINEGRTGRGEEQLSDSQHAFIESIARVYRDRYDLSAIGL